jgi:hypothetical protein
MRGLTPAARLLGALAVLAAAGATSASACAICLSAISVTGADRLEAADRAVLAVPGEVGLGIVAVVKGEAKGGDMIDAPGLDEAAATLPDGEALLLVRETLGGEWTSLGATDPANGPWLRELASAGLAAADPAGSETLLALAALHLEDPDALVAELAHDTIARRPYAAMATLADQLDPAQLRGWIDDPEAGARRATYLLLLGLAGGPDDASEIAQWIETAREVNDATDLAALLAAGLELEGPGRVDWIERAYITDRGRTLPEIEAALLALAVHGDADATVPRERVVAAYRLFIRERKPMAGFVAHELAEWQAWDATGDYVALLQAGLVTDPAEEFAILSYIGQSPDAEAKAVLADD